MPVAVLTVWCGVGCGVVVCGVVWGGVGCGVCVGCSPNVIGATPMLVWTIISFCLRRRMKANRK